MAHGPRAMKVSLLIIFMFLNLSVLGVYNTQN